ncbi:MAG TPA: TlpA disulfide reductase family protein [Pyrinomonadaceae bacterium]
MRAFCRKMVLVVLVAVAGATWLSAQTKAPAPKTIFRDSNGSLITNNEFVDIRMANPHYPDATVVKTHDDGTIEFRLQKIPQEGMRAPEFAFKTLDGKMTSAADLRGKVVVLNFWFIGCHVCRALKPELNKFKAKFADRDDVVFIAATADPASEVEQFLKKEPFDYLHAAGADAELKRFVFSGYPKNIVISKTGEIVYWRTTLTAWDKFESVVRAELAR